MICVVLACDRSSPDRISLTVRRREEIAHYTFTREVTSIADVIEYDGAFHRDFRDAIDQRMSLLSLARKIFQGEEVEYPVLIEN